MQKIENRLLQFIDDTPNAYYCVENLKKMLKTNGFEQLYENNVWDLKANRKYFVIRNDASLIAFKTNEGMEVPSFNITASHTDSPCLTIKTNPYIYDKNYLKLNINGYGGMLNYSWLDRPLSIAGRVVTLNDGVYEKHLVNIDKDLLIIPSQASHINREANTKNELNLQKDMLPILSLSNDKSMEDIIRENLESRGIKADIICDYDLSLYNRDKAKITGLNDEFILAPRLDDLANLFPSFIGFLTSFNEDSINVFCAFDKEEVGNTNSHGAASTFLIDTLTRISESLDINLLVALNNSMVVSADSSHANHPNAKEKNDPTNTVLLNGGVTLKHHKNYPTDAITSSIFKGICNNANIPYQDYASRADMLCGITLGLTSQRKVSVDTVDIGIPQLAMHSANETIGSNDIIYMCKAVNEFYSTKILKQENKIKLLRR